jgi:hypothetical protein
MQSEEGYLIKGKCQTLEINKEAKIVVIARRMAAVT